MDDANSENRGTSRPFGLPRPEASGDTMPTMAPIQPSAARLWPMSIAFAQELPPPAAA